MSEASPSSMEPDSAKQHPARGNLVARDLWWVASSPPLMGAIERLPQLSESRRAELRDEVLPAVRLLETMSLEGALRAIGAQGWRVGHYFESLVGYWLQQLRGWELIARDHLVRREKRTLGAYDFIVRNAQDRVEHWEVAVKFYLRRGQQSEWRSWVGPNQRDRLDKKVNRMRDHQLVLARREEGQAALSELGVSTIDQQVVLLKGAFFTEWGTSPMGPVGSMSEAEGRWADERALAELDHAFQGSCWLRREKPFWLAPLHRVALERELAGLPAKVERPEMWARLERSSSGSWDEVERWFLVPADWHDGR